MPFKTISKSSLENFSWKFCFLSYAWLLVVVMGCPYMQQALVTFKMCLSNIWQFIIRFSVSLLEFILFGSLGTFWIWICFLSRKKKDTFIATNQLCFFLFLSFLWTLQQKYLACLMMTLNLSLLFFILILWLCEKHCSHWFFFCLMYFTSPLDWNFLLLLYSEAL